MDIKNWKQSPKIQEAKEKLEDEKVRGFMRWVFEIVVRKNTFPLKTSGESCC